jgi:hypothetical protein
MGVPYISALQILNKMVEVAEGIKACKGRWGWVASHAKNEWLEDCVKYRALRGGQRSGEHQ